MSSHSAVVEWALEGDFPSGRYSRSHHLQFDGGVRVAGSASPFVVTEPFSTPDAVDPEEMFVASLSACHMLWFLHRARDAGLTVVSYRDQATGRMATDRHGRMAMVEVVLDPQIDFEGVRPSAFDIDHLHHRAHDACFIANSVLTQVRIKPSV